MALPFEAIEGGTRVTESYEVKRIPVWARVVDIPTNRARELRDVDGAHAGPLEDGGRGS